MKASTIFLLLATSALTHISLTAPETGVALANSLVTCVSDVRGVISAAEKVADDHTDISAIIQCGKDAYGAIRSCSAAYHDIRSPACRTAVNTFISHARSDADKLVHQPKSAISDAADVARCGEAVVDACSK